MSSEFGIAILGCGKIAATHAKQLASAEGVALYFASRDAAQAEAYARRFKGAGAFGSYEEAIADPRIDAVVVATPPNSHCTLALAALDKGKHVVVEKPPFMSVAEFDRVAAARQAAGRQVFVAENYFYKPLAVAMRRVLASGAIGDLRILQVNALKQQTVGGWRDEERMGGPGALFEGGIHWVNFMANLGPEIVGVQAFRPVPGEGPERTMVVAFQYATGAVGTLYYSWETDVALKGLHLSAAYGSKGVATFESNGLFVAVRGERKSCAGPSRDISGFGAMWRDFVPALRDNREAAFGFDAARRDLVLVEAAYRSLGRDLSPGAFAAPPGR